MIITIGHFFAIPLGVSMSRLAAKAVMCCALLAFLSVFNTASVAADLVTKISSKNCIQGLYPQPPGGPFSVFLFCDDAMGDNIGIVNTSGGAGPGTIVLAPPMVWDKWDVNNRFWQEPDWATDVTSFAWTADLKYLYVATSSVYGKGGLYKLDLVRRTYVRLLPHQGSSRPSESAYQSIIIGINRHSGIVTVSSTFFDTTANKMESQTVQISH